MGHPLRNIIGIIFLVSAIFFISGATDQKEIITITDQVAIVKAFSPSLKTGISSEINLGARAYLSAYLAPGGSLEVLVEKDGHKQVPIASITKLMTAFVATNEFGPGATAALSVEEGAPAFTVKALLDSLLMESSNESAAALARLGGGQEFIKQMNVTARDLGMSETYYLNSSGLDEASGSNFSSAYNLLTLTKKILTERPDILAITRQTTIPIIDTNGQEDHLAQTTNELLTANHWPAEIVGGKTGTTPMAKTNLVLVLRDQATGGYLINVVLGSDDHFGEMTKLIDWVYASYEFKV